MKFLRLLEENIQLLVTKLWYSFQKRDKDLWVLGEWLGERCCDNCMYFANFVATNHQNIRLVWIYKEGADLSSLNSRIRRCLMDSPEAAKILKRAGAVFMVGGMNDLIENKSHFYSGALTVNFWHGVPWKKIHYDMPYGFCNKLYLYMRTSMFGGKILLSTSEKFSAILHSAFKSKDTCIINAGYPRNSIFYKLSEIESARNKLYDTLKNKGYTIDDTTNIVTYMPTFRDNKQEVFSFYDIVEDTRLETLLDKHNAIIVQKGHFVSTHQQVTRNVESKRVVQINDFPAQELLAASDILITDYSSCFFDYLVLDRPIIHYLYDYNYYCHDDRGLYYPKEDVACGDVAEKVDELIKYIDENLSNPFKHKSLRKQRKDLYLQYESEDSCEKIYNDILGRL